MSKLYIFFAVAIVVLMFAAVFIFFMLSRPPHSIPEEQVSATYLNALGNVGDYEKQNIETGSKSALFIDDSQNSQGIFVRYTEDMVVFDQVIEEYDRKNCSASWGTNGSQGGISYRKFSCDESAYYIYTLNDERGLLFETIDEGRANLEEFIEKFIRAN